MRIVIDGRMLNWTGVGRYTLALLEELEQIEQDNTYQVLVRRADWDRWTPKVPGFEKIECNIDPYTLGEQLRLPGVLRHLSPDLVHLVTPNAATFYGGKRVVTVHDLTLLDYDTSRGSGPAKWARGLKRIPFRWILERQVRRATQITVGSEYVKDQLRGRFGVAESRVSVVPLAAGASHLVAASHEPVHGLTAKDEFLLYVGNYYPYKNVGVLLRAFGQLAKLRPEIKLVLAGKPDAFQATLSEESVKMGLLDRVLLPGFVGDGQLKWLYANAAVFVYPSLSEGFGLQGLEAMTQDLPVVAARASCLPEVYGNAAEYFNPSSPADLAKKLDELLDNPKRLAELRAAGRERVKLFSWRQMAEQTLAAYEQAGRQPTR